MHVGNNWNMTMKHLTIKHDLKVYGAQVRKMNWIICADLGEKSLWGIVRGFEMEHDISMKNCSCHHISTSRWKEFRTHFFFNNLFDTYFWQRGGKNVVHIFVYQREVQDVFFYGFEAAVSAPCGRVANASFLACRSSACSGVWPFRIRCQRASFLCLCRLGCLSATVLYLCFVLRFRSCSFGTVWKGCERTVFGLPELGL